MICYVHHVALIHTRRHGVNILACPVNGCNFVKADKHGRRNMKTESKCQVIVDNKFSECEQPGTLCRVRTGVATIEMTICDDDITRLLREHLHWIITKVTL